MENKVKKILYLFYGAKRRELLDNYKKKLSPSNSFFGYYDLKKYFTDTQVDFIEYDKERDKNNGILNFIVKYFGIESFFLYHLWFIKKYDYIVSSVGLECMFIKSLLQIKKPKWFFINIQLTNLLYKNKKNKLKYFLLLNIIKRIDKVICLSRKQMKYLMEAGVSESKLIFMPFGVDKDYYLESSEDDGYILSVGADLGRDFPTLIDAFKENKMELIIVTSIHRHPLGDEIANNIKILYDIKYTEIRELYGRAKIIVVQSKKESNTDGSDCSGQTVILEAMACGKPVIATRRDWMNDYFTNNKEILIIEPEDKDGLKRSVDYLIKNDNVAKKMGIAARKIIEEKYNSYKMAEGIYNLVKNN